MLLDLTRHLGRVIYLGNVPVTYHLFTCVTHQPLGCLVEDEDGPLPIYTNDGINGALDKIFLKVIHLSQFLCRILNLNLQITRIFLELVSHPQHVLSTLDGDHKGLVSNGLVEEVRGLQLEGFDSRFHITMASNDDHLGLRIKCLDLP